MTIRKTSPETAAAIEEALKSDTVISQFVTEGTALLKETNRPNIITLEQFAPFVPLFNVDPTKYIPHSGPGSGRPNQYTRDLNDLYRRWRFELGINQYEVTYVVKSAEDRTIVYYLDRQLTRLRSDSYEGESSRGDVPSNVPRGGPTTKEDLVIDASYKDLVLANSTPDQTQRIGQLKMESAVIARHFAERNQTPSLRPDVLKDGDTDGPDASDDDLGITLDDE
jgi:hypothetical protein